MKVVSGTFNGTGAAVYIGVGFVPDKVIVRNVENASIFEATWSKHFRSSEQIDGLMATTGVPAVQTATQGIQPYEGGDLLTSSNQTTTTYGEGVYLYKDPIVDYRSKDVATGAVAIDTWTLDNSGNRAGHFNVDCADTYCGEGSRICIDGKWYVITTLGATATSASAVVLSRAAPSGTINCITGMYDWIPQPLGQLSLAGFVINNTTLNVNTEIMMFEAYSFEM